MAQRAAPQHHINWIAAGAIGLVALGFGLYLLIDTDNATQLIGAIIAFALLLASLIHLLQGFRRNANGIGARFALLSGGVGASVGAIVTTNLAYDFLTAPAARLILAGGLIVYGVLSLAGLAVDRKADNLLRTILASVFALVFAALLIYNSQSAELESRWFAAGLIIVGLILLGLAAWTYRRHNPAQTSGKDTGRAPGNESTNRSAPSSRGDQRSGPSSPTASSTPTRPDTAATPASDPSPRSTGTRAGGSEPTLTDAGSSEPIAAGPPRMAPTERSNDGPAVSNEELPDDHNFDPFTGERIRPARDATPTGRGPFTPERP